MKLRNLAIVLIATMLLNHVGQVARADLVLSFTADNGATFSNSFDVTTGDSLSIGIYARETAPDNVLSTEGLIAFGFDVTSSPTGLGTISAATANPFFDLENHNVTTASGFEWEYVEMANTGFQASDIFLGSFQFDTTTDGTTVFTVEDRLVGSGVGDASWLTPALDILDESFFGPGATNTFQFSINASAVPEPNSFVFLLGSAGLAAGLRRRRIR